MADFSGWKIIPPNVPQSAAPVNFPAIDAARGPGGAAKMLQTREALGGGWGFQDETIGFVANEVQAGVNASMDFVRDRFKGGKVSWGDLYDEYLTIANTDRAAYREAHPTAATAANVVGGLAMGRPDRAVGAALAPMTTREAVKTGVKTGAGIGGAIGFLEGEGVTGRLESAAWGAGTGAAIGAAFPLVTNLVSRVSGALGRLKGLKGPEAKTRAEQMVLRALERDGIDPATLHARARTGKPLTLADLGPNTRDLVGAAGRQGGEGKKILEDFFEARTVGQYGRVMDDVATRTGVNARDFARTEASIAGKRAAEARAGYPAAYKNAGPALSENATGILGTPTGKAAVARAARTMADKRAPIRDASGNYSVQMLDQIQREMRDFASVASRAGRGGAAGDVGTLRDQFLAELPDDLRGVMANYRTKSELLDAMKLGRDFLKGDAEGVAAAMRGMAPQEQEMFRLGVARELQTSLGRKGDGGDITAIFANPQMRERLASIFPSKRMFQDFMDSVASERTMQATRNSILKGSPTAPRMVANEEFSTEALGEFASDVIQGGANTTGVVRALGNAALRGRERLLQGVNENVAREVATMATNPAMTVGGGGSTALTMYPVAPFALPTGNALAATAAAGPQARPVGNSGWRIIPSQ
jgi:hypothetical protein